MFRVVHFFVCRVTNPCNYRNAAGLESKDIYKETRGVGGFDSVGGVAILSVYVCVCVWNGMKTGHAYVWIYMMDICPATGLGTLVIWLQLCLFLAPSLPLAPPWFFAQFFFLWVSLWLLLYSCRRFLQNVARSCVVLYCQDCKPFLCPRDTNMYFSENYCTRRAVGVF